MTRVKVPWGSSWNFFFMHYFVNSYVVKHNNVIDYIYFEKNKTAKISMSLTHYIIL